MSSCHFIKSLGALKQCFWNCQGNARRWRVKGNVTLRAWVGSRSYCCLEFRAAVQGNIVEQPVRQGNCNCVFTGSGTEFAPGVADMKVDSNWRDSEGCCNPLRTLSMRQFPETFAFSHRKRFKILSFRSNDLQFPPPNPARRRTLSWLTERFPQDMTKFGYAVECALKSARFLVGESANPPSC